MDIQTFIVFSAFAAAAIAECAAGFMAVKNAVKPVQDIVITLPVSGNMPEAELILRQVLDMMNRSPFRCTAVILDMGADNATLDICRKFAEEHGGFEIKTEQTI